MSSECCQSGTGEGCSPVIAVAIYPRISNLSSHIEHDLADTGFCSSFEAVIQRGLSTVSAALNVAFALVA